MTCAFEDLCENSGDKSYCYSCYHNSEATTVDNFEWNGEDEEPTQEELDAETY